MNEIVAFLLDNAGAVAARVIIGALVAGVLGAIVVTVAIVMARRGRWLHVGAPFDPWPGRASFAVWIVVALPAFAIAGALIGLGYAAQNAVEKNRVAERACHAALSGVLTQVLADDEARRYVNGGSIRIDDVAAFVERAPVALERAEPGAASTTTRDANGAGDGTFLHTSAEAARAIGAWFVRSEAVDRLLLVRPVIADLKARDVDNDGRVALADVLDTAVRIHLEPRAAHFARKLVAGNAVAPGGVALGALALPLLACFIARKRRAT